MITEKSLYPLKLKPLHLEKLWGGQKLAALEGFSDARLIGERWDVACQEDKVSLVANGFFKDLRFDEVIRQNQRLWLGNSAPDRDFPLLIKLIDRETGQTSYALVKELRNGFSAFLWQGVGRLFGMNLKDTYDPTGDDEFIEILIRLYEAGYL